MSLPVQGFCADLVFDGDRFHRSACVTMSEGRVVELRPRRASDPKPMKGLLCPGFINAHLHLELSAVGLVPGGDTFGAWASAMMKVRRGLTKEQLLQGMETQAAYLKQRGTVAVGDVSGDGERAALSRHQIQGVVWREQVGFRPGQQERCHQLMTESAEVDAGLVCRSAPHAIYSASGPLLTAAGVRQPGAPAMIHAAETSAEALFLQGEGAFVDFLAGLGIDIGWWTPPKMGVVDYLATRDLLRSDVLLVHMVAASHEELDQVARAHAPVVLCPRSNLHLSGQLPDVQAMIDRGVRLALGTDSLASTPTLDVYDDACLLGRRFGHHRVWWRALTSGGADALLRPDLGRLAPGTSPGLLHLPTVDAPDRWPTSPPVERLVPAVYNPHLATGESPS